MTRSLLRADAVLFALVGVVLLLSPWDALFRALGLPQGSPPLWTQIAGLLLLALAYLLWVAPRDVRLTQAVSLAAGAANVAAAVLIGAWVLFADPGTAGRGSALLLAIAAAAVVVGVLELRIASRSVAMLLPPD